ncbi:MAG: radical SAM protein [Nanoarchaeota archaeon]
MNILLIEPKRSIYTSTTLSNKFYAIPHLGLLSIAANLESDGHMVDYFSTNSYRDPLRSLDRVLRRGYDYVGLSTVGNTIDFQLGMASAVKEYSTKTKVVLGGTHAWLNPGEVLEDPNVDFVIRGFGEMPFKRLIAGQSLDSIPGLCYNQENKVVIKAPYLPDQNELNQLKSILDYSKYEKVYSRVETFRNQRQLVTSFGCPFGCNFCSVPKMYGGKMLFRDLTQVLAEVRELSKRTSRIFFQDPNLNVDRNHFTNLFTGILERKKTGEIQKKVKFLIQARIDCFDDDLLRLAKRANVGALIGIESLSQRVRDTDLNKGGMLARMSKEELIEQMDKVSEYIPIFPYFILATPETREQDLIENLSYISSLKKGRCEVDNYITPFKGTDYFSKCKDSDLMVWREYATGSGTKTIPDGLLCKDKRVVDRIYKAFSKAVKKHKKNPRSSFKSIFLADLIEDAGFKPAGG